MSKRNPDHVKGNFLRADAGSQPLDKQDPKLLTMFLRNCGAKTAVSPLDWP